MGSLQREVSADAGTGGSAGLQGVDLPQPEAAVAGEGGGGQEPQDAGLPGLHEVGHASHAQPGQRAHPSHGAVLRPTVGEVQPAPHGPECGGDAGWGSVAWV